eukprot:g55358.t1
MQRDRRLCSSCRLAARAGSQQKTRNRAYTLRFESCQLCIMWLLSACVFICIVEASQLACMVPTWNRYHSKS